MSATDAGGVKSADRAIAILEHLAASGTASFTELSDALNLPRSSASALLATLENAGWITRDTQRRFSVGLKSWQVGHAYRGHLEIPEKAKPFMDALASALGETVQLARLDGTENVYIGISESPHPMRLASAIGLRLPSHATGIGKALLSQLPPAERARRLSNARLEKLTSRTVVNPEQLLGILADVARRGVAVDEEEYVEGCRCVAVPLHTGSVGIETALSVTVPSFRASANWPEDVLPSLRNTAEGIREVLGLPPIPTSR